MVKTLQALLPDERIESCIFWLRGKKVMDTKALCKNKPHITNVPEAYENNADDDDRSS